MQDNFSTLNPQIWRYLRRGMAVVAGFNLDEVQETACKLVRRGFLPVEDDYCLMEHKKTGKQGHFRKVTFIKK